jgi:hypothetical protein
MQQFATNTGATALTATSALALALGMGMGATPAQAELVITAFTQAQNDTLHAGGTVTFGPEDGFNASFDNSQDPKSVLTLSGVGNNKVAIEPGCSTFDGADCLAILNPGDVVDGSLTFASTGAFETDSIVFGPRDDGHYFFGLNAIPNSSPDPFGWVEISLNDGLPTLERYAFQDNEREGATVPTEVPEPAMLPLFAVGAAAVLAARRRKRAQA